MAGVECRACGEVLMVPIVVSVGWFKAAVADYSPRGRAELRVWARCHHGRFEPVRPRYPWWWLPGSLS